MAEWADALGKISAMDNARVVEWPTRMFEGHVAVEAGGVQVSFRAL